MSIDAFTGAFSLLLRRQFVSPSRVFVRHDEGHGARKSQSELTTHQDPTKDPRAGSHRDGETSVSGKNLTGGTNSNSFATLFSTLAPTAIYAAVCLIIFWTLRRRYPRVYAPRTFLSSLEPHERTVAIPVTWFTWVKDFYRIPDTEALNRSSLDGFLFLRYMKLLCVICMFGMVLTWPTLIPLHFYGGKGLKQLDALSFGNVDNVKICFVHAIEAWILFGFILYLLSRECVYFINLRQAYLLSPHYANRLSSRTVLFSCVPREVLTEKKIRRIFGDTVKSVWIPREADDLEKLVDEREQTAARLQKAEIALIRKANAAYQKAVRAGHPVIQDPTDSQGDEEKKVDVTVTSNRSTSPLSSPQSPVTPSGQDVPNMMSTYYGPSGPPPDVNGSVAAQWIPASHRPRHRPLANYGRRVDTIKWTRTRLKELAPKISKLRRQYRKGEGTALPAVFVEFHSQVDAQAAYQTLAHHRANHMEPEIVGLRPKDIVWSSLHMRWWERIIRRFAIQGFIAALVMFWAIPCALIGFISNIKFLSTTVFFLRWLEKLPEIVLGLISGLVPAVALAMLMALVPMIMRFCARQAGVTTKSRVELFVQNSYFLFQVIQVFLITTISSAAATVFMDIIKNPMTARDLLSANLPKASNFYISYFIIQGLAMSATRIVHLGGIFRHVLMARVGGPKLMAKRYHYLRKIHWGSVYPVFTNMGVIAITYSLIAPIVLGVALLAFFLIYLSYRYNILLVYSFERDARGLHYPRALKQTLTGVYLAEICIFGLFVVKSAYFPVVIMVGLLVFTYLVHFSISKSLSPLLYNLPRTLVAEEELRKAGNHPWDAQNLEDKDDVDPHEALETQQHNSGYDSDFDPSAPQDSVSHGQQTSRGVDVEGADAAIDTSTQAISKIIRKKYDASPIPSMIQAIDFWTYWISPDPNTKPNFALKFLHPEVFADYHILRSAIPEEVATAEITYDESVLKDAYSPYYMRNKSPRIWLPKDAAGVSKQEVTHCNQVIECRDSDAWMDEKGLIEVDLDGETERWALQLWERVKF